MKNVLDAHAIDDELAPRTPIDSAARRVVAAGQHFMFANKSDEVCSQVPIPCRLRPSDADSLPYFEGAKFGKLTVIGIATLENNGDGYTRKDPLQRYNVSKKISKNYKGRRPAFTIIKSGSRGGLRWVCRCACGMYTLRSTNAIRNQIDSAENLRFDDACFQCRQLDKLRCGVIPIKDRQRDGS